MCTLPVMVELDLLLHVPTRSAGMVCACAMRAAPESSSAALNETMLRGCGGRVRACACTSVYVFTEAGAVKEVAVAVAGAVAGGVGGESGVGEVEGVGSGIGGCVPASRIAKEAAIDRDPPTAALSGRSPAPPRHDIPPVHGPRPTVHSSQSTASSSIWTRAHR
jgi:hypothetical protein